eukprot:TRINITY_DN824_c0_g4_i2.p1 TRINITY_DN824_c0_g4~~TRINITY_DN824_c0_g4_i2.p1  ORF type:complete len:701 (-),score=123.91 TRINITY_DN824_c0_g4_i2:418-2466(-)
MALAREESRVSQGNVVDATEGKHDQAPPLAASSTMSSLNTLLDEAAPFPHLNDANIHPMDAKVQARHQAGSDSPRSSPRGFQPTIGSKPVALQDDLAAFATIAGELHALNASFASLAAGQTEMRLVLAQLRGGTLGEVSREGTGSHNAGLYGSMEVSKESRPACNGNGTSNTAGGGPMSLSAFASKMGLDSGILAQKRQSLGCMSSNRADSFSKKISMTSTESQKSKKSRSNFNALRTMDEDMIELRACFERASELKRLERQKPPLVERMRNMSKHEEEFLVDGLIGILICVNALFIGYSIDAPPSHEGVIFVADVVFSVLFMLELAFKIRLNGLRGQFCGEASKMNLFDASLIAVDTAQLIFTQVAKATTGSWAELPSVSLFRVLRLVRLARLLRLLRYHVFDDLIAMIGGMVGGLSTLLWAGVVYVFAIYCIALMFREAFGHYEVENVYEYFDDVPRAMFTTFRCSLGDCSTASGMPIFEHVDQQYGPGYNLIYFAFMFSFTVGLFNVISAVFVDATLAAAEKLRYSQKKARLKDEDLWCTRIFTLVRKLAERKDLDIQTDPTLIDVLEHIYELDVETTTMRDMVADPDVQRALTDLEIDPEDHEQLAEILDPDQGGSITIIELIDGLKRLRGDPKRSDIVQLDLMLRSIMGVVQDIQAAVVVPEPVSPAFSTKAQVGGR